MSQQRKIELTIHPEANSHNTSLQQAIGYAAMWGNPEEVHIFVDKDNNVSASYLKNGNRTFYMEGFPNHCTTDGKYCFHS